MIKNHKPHKVKRTSGIPSFPKADKRLLGTWKSDRNRTFREWSWAKKLSPLKKKRFQAIFGKLEITYTRTKVISTLRHQKWAQTRRYVVAATDETSVAIVQYGRTEIKNRLRYDAENLKMVADLFGSKPDIQHIHFDKKHYWISLGNGRNREFFRKIRNRN
ncbi:MAG: hypothetical protein WDM80_12280 [Limisphaerales bacterium]